MILLFLSKLLQNFIIYAKYIFIEDTFDFFLRKAFLFEPLRKKRKCIGGAVVQKSADSVKIASEAEAFPAADVHDVPRVCRDGGKALAGILVLRLQKFRAEVQA